MNTRTLVAPPVPTRRETTTTPTPENAPAGDPHVAKKTAPVAHPLETLLPRTPPTLPQAVPEPAAAEPQAATTEAAEAVEAVEAEDAEQPQRGTLWARLAAVFGRSDRPKPERSDARGDDDHEGYHAIPKRPDFLLDAAMAREMYRL